MLRKLVPALSIVVALLLAACGSGGDLQSGASATPAIGPDATVARAPATPPPAAVRPVLPAIVMDMDGRQVTVSDASRIIPLNGDIAEVMWALGLGVNVVATDTSATYPEAATRLPRSGYQRSLSAEGILSLRPTLLIGTETAGPPAVIEQIRSAGVPVVILPAVMSLEGIAPKIRGVAAALGVAPAGDALAAQTTAEIEAAKRLAQQATSKPRVAFLYVRGGATQQIGGVGTSADALIAAAGAEDAGVAAGIRGFQPITAEAIVTAKPDVLLLLSAGLASVGGVEGLLAIPGIAQAPAGRAKRVLDFEDQYLLGMGPRTGLVLMELVKALHPELR
jgi:iron complex transport system substrate-binding protein